MIIKNGGEKREERNEIQKIKSIVQMKNTFTGQFQGGGRMRDSGRLISRRSAVICSGYNS